jgi:hypothetical protein
MSEPVTLICAPTSLQPNPDPGSIEQWCDLCAEPVWVSPSSSAAMRRWAAEGTEVHVRCLACVAGLIKDDDPIGAVREASPEFKRKIASLKTLAAEHGTDAVIRTMTGES